MKKRLRSKFFDAEGLTTKKQHLIENGTLKFFFNCLSTARQLKDTPSRQWIEIYFFNSKRIIFKSLFR